MTSLQSLKSTKIILLSTFKRDGTPVATPVNVVFDGDRAFFRTFDKAWKSKRIANNPSVEAAPATRGGKPRGETVTARAVLLEGDEAQAASRLLARSQPVMHGVLVPLMHRARRYRTLHYELLADGDGDQSAAQAAG